MQPLDYIDQKGAVGLTLKDLNEFCGRITAELKQTEDDNKFKKELEELINRHCVENASDTPDYILATYMFNCLQIFTLTTRQRDAWWGHKHTE